MTKNGHNIGKLYFDLEAANEKQALEIQDKLSRYNRNEIKGILEEIFNKAVPGDSLAVIERLDIDLGNISFEDFPSEFPRLFKDKLYEKLSEIRYDIPKDSENVQIYTKDQSDVNTLKTFLLTSNVPWYQVSSFPDLQATLEKLFLSEPDKIMPFIREHIAKPSFQERLVYQFPEKIVNKLFENLFEISLSTYLEFIDQLLDVLKKTSLPALRNSASKDILRVILTGIIVDSGNKALFNFEENFLIRLAERIPVKYENILRELLINSSKDEKEFVLKIRSLQKKSGKFSGKEPESSSEKISETEDKEEAGSNRITNAGLILLHPFLPELFRKLNFTRGDTFTGEYVIFKAIHLLQYLVSGNLPQPEHFLILNKILCGYPREKPVPLEVSLNRQEKTAATEMVKAAIRHWKTLKNTSVNGFRNNFLQRQGILKQKQERWRLQVERKAYDVLLDKIPWSYNTVKLPWMKKIIETEW